MRARRSWKKRDPIGSRPVTKEKADYGVNLFPNLNKLLKKFLCVPLRIPVPFPMAIYIL